MKKFLLLLILCLSLTSFIYADDKDSADSIYTVTEEEFNKLINTSYDNSLIYVRYKHFNKDVPFFQIIGFVQIDKDKLFTNFDVLASQDHLYTLYKKYKKDVSGKYFVKAIDPLAESNEKYTVKEKAEMLKKSAILAKLPWTDTFVDVSEPVVDYMLKINFLHSDYEEREDVKFSDFKFQDNAYVKERVKEETGVKYATYYYFVNKKLSGVKTIIESPTDNNIYKADKFIYEHKILSYDTKITAF